MTTSNEHNNAPVTCGNGCDCLVQCGDAYAHAGLPKPPDTEKAATAPAVPQGFKPVGYLRSDEFDGHTFEPINGEWPLGELLFSATPAPAPAQGEPFGYFRAEPFGWTDCSEDDEGAIALYEHPAKPAQAVGLTGPVVAWRMRDTGFRRPTYVYFDTKEQAVSQAAHLLQSRDDGHLTELTPLCEATTGPEQDTSPAQEVGLADGDLLNWIERQDLQELSMGVVLDAPHDGEYFVTGDDGVTHYGKTLRAAIIAALRAKGGK